MLADEFEEPLERPGLTDARTDLLRSQSLITLLDNLPGAAYRCEAAPPWRVTFISKGIERLSGRSVAEFEQGHFAWAEMVHPGDIEDVQRQVQIAVSQGEPFDIQYRILDVFGQIRWVHERGEPVPDPSGPPMLIGYVHDITEHRMSRQALEQSEATKRDILNASPDGVCLIDANGRITYANSSFARGLVPSGEELQTAGAWLECFSAEDRNKVQAALKSALRGEVVHFSTTPRDVVERWIEYVVAPVRGADGKPLQAIAIARDVSERKQAEAELVWTASHDNLTALPNRAVLQDYLESLVCGSESFALILLDLDQFKQINDTAGHDTGDALLKTLGYRLARDKVASCVARLGGDEFALIIRGIASPHELASQLDGLLARVREPRIYNGRVLDPRASIGAALYPFHGTSREELMKSADIALYAAKEEGRDRYRIFSSEMRERVQLRASMLSLAREALRNDSIEPFYQPKMSLAEGRPKGLEALLRWRHASGEVQLPGALSAAFEDAELAGLISERMMNRVFSDMRTWLRAGVEFDHVVLNVGAIEITHEGFSDRIVDALHAAGIPPAKLQIEVMESVFLGAGSKNVADNLRLLSASGIKIALDDFGTGFASLTHLKAFDVDVLKIDQSFIKGLTTNAEDTEIVNALIQLGRNLGLEVVAEGVETESQVEKLKSFGCNVVQGFLFSGAVCATDVPILLQRLCSLHRDA